MSAKGQKQTLVGSLQCPTYLAAEKIGNLASEEIGYLKKLEPRQILARLRTLKSL
jgi:hypothetical protein